MNHLTEEQLVEQYYGEAEGLGGESHLESCAECRDRLADLQRVLNSVNAWPIPERGANYASSVWRGLEGRIPVRRQRSWAWMPKWITVGALSALVALSFLAGRWSGKPSTPGPVAKNVPAAGAGSGRAQVRERVLLVALGQHLEQSQRVLIELSNSGPEALEQQQEAAEDLLASNRLYRMAAARGAEPGVASVLDDLERLLTDVSHASPDEFEAIRQRMADQGILFKVRVVESNVRQRQQEQSPMVRF